MKFTAGEIRQAIGIYGNLMGSGKVQINGGTQRYITIRKKMKKNQNKGGRYKFETRDTHSLFKTMVGFRQAMQYTHRL